MRRTFLSLTTVLSAIGHVHAGSMDSTSTTTTYLGISQVAINECSRNQHFNFCRYLRLCRGGNRMKSMRNVIWILSLSTACSSGTAAPEGRVDRVVLELPNGSPKSQALPMGYTAQLTF